MQLVIQYEEMIPYRGNGAPSLLHRVIETFRLRPKALKAESLSNVELHIEIEEERAMI